MKTYILCIALLCCTIKAFTQTYYYSSTKSFNESGYTYQCDVLKKHVTLYNKSNKYTYVDQVDRYTNKLISISENRAKLMEDDTWTKPKCYSIVNGAFSYVEKQRLKEYKILIIMYINPDTGKVVEVKFRFTSTDPYATIPVSVYRKIETELKEKIWFIPTDEGKRRNYIICGWMHGVE